MAFRNTLIAWSWLVESFEFGKAFLRVILRVIFPNFLRVSDKLLKSFLVPPVLIFSRNHVIRTVIWTTLSCYLQIPRCHCLIAVYIPLRTRTKIQSQRRFGKCIIIIIVIVDRNFTGIKFINKLEKFTILKLWIVILVEQLRVLNHNKIHVRRSTLNQSLLLVHQIDILDRWFLKRLL